MPFDKQSGPIAIGQLALPRDISRTYVPMTREPGPYRVLDGERQQVLEAWVDTLIPATEVWPAPTAVGVPQYVDNCTSATATGRQTLLNLVDEVAEIAQESCGSSFDACSQQERVDVLKRVEAEHAPEFSMVLELTFEGYYRNRLVARIVQDRTGFRVGGPLAGIPDEPFPESMLADMAKRPKRYIEVAS